MLFDLRGKRRRLVQVVYAALAVIFAVTFVGFGIGSDAAGGIFDALGIGGGHGGGGGGSSDPQLERDIDSAEERLEGNPKDREALRRLARVRFLAGQVELDQDESGQPVLTEEAREQYEQAADAWQRYLRTDPKDPDSDLANLIVQAYIQLNDAEGAIETQRIVAAEDPSAGTLSNLAFYLYIGLRIDEADRVAERAIAAASPEQKEQFRGQLEQIAMQAKQAKRQQDRLPEGGAGGEEELGRPFGELGGGAPAPSP